MATTTGSLSTNTFAVGPQKHRTAEQPNSQMGQDVLQDTLFTRLCGSFTESMQRSSKDACRAGPYAGYGVKSEKGQRAAMEDAFAVQEALSPADEKDPNGSPPSKRAAQNVMVPFLPADLSVFAVFDGHGGDAVAQHCSSRLSRLFASQLCLARMDNATAVGSPLAASATDPSTDAFDSPPERAPADSTLARPVVRTALSDSPESLNAIVDSCRGLLQGPLGRETVTTALRRAFELTDSELAGSEDGEYVGATAVVAVVGKDLIWVAHCGDSRAVLMRGGEAEALTRDHKPDREDEAARIKAAGGRIVYSGGSHRVMGMLAMSRAIGDHYLRPYVIAEPEVTCVERTATDEVLVIATDGLWDVFTCKEATLLASRCIGRSKERGMSRHGACRVAASVLTKVALERGSRDNITVIVIDISLPTEEELQQGSSGNAMVPSSAQPADGSSPEPSSSKGGSASMGQAFHIKSQLGAQGGGGAGSGSGGPQGGGSAHAKSFTTGGGHPQSGQGGSGSPCEPPTSLGTKVRAAAGDPQRRQGLDRLLSAPPTQPQCSPNGPVSAAAGAAAAAAQGGGPRQQHQHQQEGQQRQEEVGGPEGGPPCCSSMRVAGGAGSPELETVVDEGEEAEEEQEEGSSCRGDISMSLVDVDASEGGATSVHSGSSLASLTDMGAGLLQQPGRQPPGGDPAAGCNGCSHSGALDQQGLMPSCISISAHQGQAPSQKGGRSSSRSSAMPAVAPGPGTKAGLQALVVLRVEEDEGDGVCAAAAPATPCAVQEEALVGADE